MDTLYQYALDRLDAPEGAQETRVYVCGPMTGYPNENREAFEHAAQQLRKTRGPLQGRLYEVLSPVELDKADGLEPAEERTEEEYTNLLKRDLQKILDHDIDAIVVLDGWEDSRGAALEVHVARSLGVPVFDLDGLRVKEPTKYRPPSDENILETAQRLVGGDRQDQYGHPIDDFTRTAGVINALLGTELGPRDIPIIMVAVKLSRIMQSPDKRDSFVDAAGYLRTAEMVAEREGRPLR